MLAADYKLTNVLHSRMFSGQEAHCSPDWNVITKINSGALVRQRTIPTERPPLVGEVSAKFSG
jgi:hypothetical protein